VLLAVGDRRAIPSTWRSPITWASGGNVPPNRPADDANFAPAGPRDSPCGGRWDSALIRVPHVTAALLRLGYPGDLPSGERLLLIVYRFPCHARAARRARGAKRERALAGASGGASGPCRPGLKPYRKSSPPGMPVADRMCRRDRNGSGVGRLGFWVQHRRSWEDTWRSLIVR
jgi:hypothetical protein